MVLLLHNGSFWRKRSLNHPERKNDKGSIRNIKFWKTFASKINENKLPTLVMVSYPPFCTIPNCTNQDRKKSTTYSNLCSPVLIMLCLKLKSLGPPLTTDHRRLGKIV